MNICLLKKNINCLRILNGFWESLLKTHTIQNTKIFSSALKPILTPHVSGTQFFGVKKEPNYSWSHNGYAFFVEYILKHIFVSIYNLYIKQE